MNSVTTYNLYTLHNYIYIWIVTIFNLIHLQRNLIAPPLTSSESSLLRPSPPAIAACYFSHLQREQLAPPLTSSDSSLLCSSPPAIAACSASHLQREQLAPLLTSSESSLLHPSPPAIAACSAPHLQREQLALPLTSSESSLLHEGTRYIRTPSHAPVRVRPRTNISSSITKGNSAVSHTTCGR